MVIKQCPEGKVLNPKTNRCVNTKGAIGRKLTKTKKDCPEGKVLNPKTNRCVNTKGSIGKKLATTTKSSKSPKSPKNESCRDIYIDWINNSCYLDSLLVALFNKKDKIIEDLLLKAAINDYGSEKLNSIGLKIQKELIIIYKIISNQVLLKEKRTCVNLRKLLDRYYKELLKVKPDTVILFDKKDNWQTSQLDVFEFFEFILTIFKVSDRTLKIQDGDNIIHSNFKSLVPIDFIYKKKTLKIKDVYPKYTQKYKLNKDNIFIDANGKKQVHYTKNYEILKGNKLFISIYRNTGTTKNDISVIPCDKLGLKENGYDLHLTAIIIHYGNTPAYGHYISLYKCEDNWYEYNDMGDNIKKLGTLESIIKNDEYTKNIVGLVYSK